MPPSAVHAFYATDLPDQTRNEENTSINAQEAHIAYLNNQANLSNTQNHNAAVDAFYGIDNIPEDN